MGKAVVSTSIGCEGLAAVDGENILVRDDPSGFAEAVVAVLTDGTLRRRLEAGGRATAEGRYAWDSIGARLRETYRTLAAGA
jgi:glycosyltransferase involved in cell wall biosynthesis